MRWLAGLLLLISFSNPALSQGKQNDVGETITWSPTEKLNWHDFKNSLKGDAIEAAYSVCGIYISSSPKQVNDSTLILDVHAFFSETLSSKTTEKELLVDKVLAHEQGHFDITEWYSRVIRKDISETTFVNLEDFYKRVQIIYNRENAEYNSLQVKYDKATNHSMNTQGQAKWNKIIADGLAQYAAYTNTQLTITLKNK